MPRSWNPELLPGWISASAAPIRAWNFGWMNSQCREVNPSPNFPRHPSGGFLESPVFVLILSFFKKIPSLSPSEIGFIDTSVFRQSCPNSGFWKSIPFSLSPSPQTERKEANRATNPPQKHAGHGKTRNLHLTAETSTRLGLQVNTRGAKKASQAGAELDPPVALSPWAGSCRIWLFFLWEKGSLLSQKCSELAVVGWVWNMLLLPELLGARPPPAGIHCTELKKKSHFAVWLSHTWLDKAEKPTDTVRGGGSWLQNSRRILRFPRFP